MAQLPQSILDASNETIQQMLPDKSHDRYILAYNKFLNWRSTQNTDSFEEEVFLAYFGEAAKEYAPSTLWSMYSMLKGTINCNHNVNIAQYARLIGFLKKKNLGFEGKKSPVFSAEDIRNFLMNAPDLQYIAIKVIFLRLCIFFIKHVNHFAGCDCFRSMWCVSW